MAEYINRNDALKQVLLVETRESMFQCIKNLPAADVVERKTGKWLKSAWSIRCSECEYDMPFAVRNFCPNCGAKMEESTDV